VEQAGSCLYYFTWRNFAKLTGRTPERLEPLEVYAHAPGLLRGYGRLDQATAKLHRLPCRLQVLAVPKATTLIHCEFCIDLPPRSDQPRDRNRSRAARASHE
jgi:hypothetical protein